MIIRPRNLEDMEAQLRAVPGAKRKVIVFVGRHPNEGTINIALRHHEQWEKHGAVVVRIPAQWTPHWLWKTAEKQKLDRRAVKRLIAKLPFDTEISSFLASRGFNVPVVHFHGTPITNIAKNKGALSFPGLWWAAVKSHSRVSYLNFPWKVREPNLHENELFIEFHFDYSSKGKQRETSAGQYGRSLAEYVKDEKSGELRVWPDGSVSSEYIDKVGRINLAAVKRFSKKHASVFEKILAKLARKGLQKPG